MEVSIKKGSWRSDTLILTLVHVLQENKLQLQHRHAETSFWREVTGKAC